ncbi:hypothetical protein ACFVVQ_27320 [Paenibacillus chitinolyticus]
MKKAGRNEACPVFNPPLIPAGLFCKPTTGEHYGSSAVGIFIF